MGTFTADGTIIPPASRPYSSDYSGGSNGTSISGTGNLMEYDQDATYLFGDSSSTESKNLKWIKLSDTLLVADRNLLCNISWQNIYKNYKARSYDEGKNSITSQNSIIGTSSGSTVTIDGHVYRVRLLTGGESVAGGEWNKLTGYTRSDDVIHWQDCYSWCAETSANGLSEFRPCRGYTSATNRIVHPAAKPDMEYGFRPALELVE